MTKRITVSSTQVAAAQLKEKRAAADGKSVDAGTRAIANAEKPRSGQWRNRSDK